MNSIQFYLSNCKQNATKPEDVKFYTDRLLYYDNLLNTDPSIEKALGFGEIPFEINRNQIKNLYDFWLNGFIWFVEKEKAREIKKKAKEKKRKENELST